MHVTIASADFKEAIAMAHAIIPGKTRLGTAKIVIEAESDGSVWVSGRTEEITIKKRIEAQKVKKAGILVLSAERTEKVAQAITADSIQLTNQGVSGILKAGQATFKLPGLPASDIPEEIPISYMPSWTMPAKSLKFMVDHTAFATDKSGSRAIFEGLLMEQTQIETRLVATDGRQLAKCWMERSGTDDEMANLLIPAKAMIAASKHFVPEEPVEIGHYEKRLVGFRQKDLSMTVRLIQGIYPSYEKVIPVKSEEEKRVYVSRQVFVDALKHMAAVAPSGNHRVTAAFNLVTILSVLEGGGGSAEIELPVKYEGEPVSVDFDVEYLIGVVNSIGGENIVLRLTAPTRAVVVEPEGQRLGISMLALVMPLRTEEA